MLTGWMNLDSAVYFNKRGLWTIPGEQLERLSKLRKYVNLGKIPSGDLHKVVKGQGLVSCRVKETSHVYNGVKINF